MALHPHWVLTTCQTTSPHPCIYPWEALMAQSAGKQKMAGLSFPKAAREELFLVQKGLVSKGFTPTREEAEFNFFLTSWVIFFSAIWLKSMCLVLAMFYFSENSNILMARYTSLQVIRALPWENGDLSKSKDFLFYFTLSSHWRKCRKGTKAETETLCCNQYIIIAKNTRPPPPALSSLPLFCLFWGRSHVTACLKQRMEALSHEQGSGRCRIRCL